MATSLTGGGILNDTRNLVKLYIHACGEDEVPKSFHVWSCLTLIAACVGDRVYFQRVREMPLYPNLYTFLIDESGIGKGRAIRFASNFVKDIPLVNYYEGKITAARLIDKLGRPQINPETGRREVANSKMFLATPELAMSIGKGELAESFIETLTELYGGSALIQEGTRAHGDVTIKNCCMNWIAGTTKEWLLKAVSPQAIQSGFFARCIAVYGDKEERRKMFRPQYPIDYQEVIGHIQARIYSLCFLRGEMSLTDEAEKYVNEWYLNRSEPEDDLMKPAWNRQRELVLKLAMLLRLSDGETLKIDYYHIRHAIKLSMINEGSMPDLVEFASRTPETSAEAQIARVLQRARTMGHSDLLRRVYRYGIGAQKAKMAISDLRQKGMIVITTTRTGGGEYTWIG